MLDYIRIACAVPEVKVGDVKKNTQDICAFMKNADEQKVDILRELEVLHLKFQFLVEL